MSVADGLLDAALGYAQLGLAVFPCHWPENGKCSCNKPDCHSPAKHPRTEHGFKNATTDPDKIREWWRQWPKANVAVATGASGLVVVDIDRRHDGFNSWLKLKSQSQFAHLGKGVPRAWTPGGGMHLYYRALEGIHVRNSEGLLGPGIDIRGEGGYVLAAPSLGINGKQYRFAPGSSLTAMPVSPRELLDLLQSRSQRASNGEDRTDKIYEGRRNDHLYRLARSLKAQGSAQDTILAALRAENQARCVPPLDDGEVDQIARHAVEQPDRPEFEEMTEEQRLIAELAQLDPLAYSRQRKQVAKKLGVNVGMLDQAVKIARDDRFEHSNSSGDSSMGTTTFDCSKTRSKAIRIITHSNTLELVRDDARRLGYAGPTDAVELIYVAATSRLLDRPVNLQVLAQSSTGKSYTVDTAFAFLPPETYYKLSACSPHALIYCQQSFKHLTVILAEADSLPEEGPAASAVRSIITDGVMCYDVVERDRRTCELTVRHIVKEGPTNLVTTGVKPLDTQNSTRTLSFGIPDDPGQTRAVVRAIGKQAAGKIVATLSDAEQEEWWSFQRYLGCTTKGCVVPFAEVLSELVPVGAVRMRRDFKQLITTIQSIAVLEQERREKTAEGLIVATIDDYAEARRLLAPLFDIIATEGLTDAIRRTVEAVPETGEASQRYLASKLGLSPSTLSWRVGRALSGGWLRNLETRKGFPYRLQRGDPLPDPVSALPRPEEIRAAFESQSSEPHSNSPSNTHETAAGEGVGEGVFECSNGFPGSGGEYHESGDGLDDLESIVW